MNENQAGEVAALLGSWRAVQRGRTTWPIIVVHHARKNGYFFRLGGDGAVAPPPAAQSCRRWVEHRATAGPYPVTLTPVGTESAMHLPA